MQQYGKEFYERDTNYFQSLEQKSEQKYWFKDYYDAILSHTDPRDRILECGCGTGITTAFLHKRRKKIIGTDFSKRFITHARKRGSYFRVMDATKLRFKNAVFDAVCSADMIEHVPHLERVLDEMSRVLKKGGYLIIQTPNLSCNLISFNYRKTVGNILRKLRFLFTDLQQPKLRTIQKYELDVIAGDKDAYTLMSPLWLKHYLHTKNYNVMYLTTYSLFFKPGPFVAALIKIISRLPLLRYVGGRIIIVAQKNNGTRNNLSH